MLRNIIAGGLGIAGGVVAVIGWLVYVFSHPHPVSDSFALVALLIISLVSVLSALTLVTQLMSLPLRWVQYVVVVVAFIASLMAMGLYFRFS